MLTGSTPGLQNQDVWETHRGACLTNVTGGTSVQLKITGLGYSFHFHLQSSWSSKYSYKQSVLHIPETV